MKCLRCDLEMLPGKAFAPTTIAALSDFGDGDLRGQTLTDGGPGVMVVVLKCPQCGYSRTPPEHPSASAESTK